MPIDLILTSQDPVLVIPAATLMLVLFAWGLVMLAAGAAICLLLRHQHVEEIERDPRPYRPGRSPAAESGPNATTVVLRPRRRMSEEYDVYVGRAGRDQVPTLALTAVPRQRGKR